MMPQRTIFVVITACLVLEMEVSCGLNHGLISGDLKRLSNPLLIKKTLHSPITTKIKLSNIPSLAPKTLLKLNMLKLKTPKIPPLPFLPILPIMSPIIPKLPLLPPLLPVFPPIPILPVLPFLPKKLKEPKLHRKTTLQKALDKQIKSALKPPPKLSKNISKILWDLKKKGSLTTPEYLRFKKLLL